MTRLPWICFWFILAAGAPGPVQAQLTEAAGLFDTANAYFTQGQYGEALDAYQQVLQTGYVSGAVYHNLGSTYFRLDEIGQAVRHFEKARRLVGDDAQLMHNIQIAQARVSSPFSVLPAPFWRNWWDSWFAMRSPVGFLVAGLVLYLCGIALMAYRIWSQIRNDWLRRLRAALLVAGCLMILIAGGISADRATSHRAVILMPGIQITAADGSIAVPEGVVVTIVAESENGVEIQLPNGVRGFVQASALGAI